MTATLDIGTGIYSLAEATKIIGRSEGHATARQIRDWMHKGLSESVEVEGNILLSFQDLVSLEMVSRFRGRGISLQAIRVADRRLRARYPELSRPFATRRFYTDGEKVWTPVGEARDPEMLELVGRVDQLAWGRVIKTFAKEIIFSRGRVVAWHPTRWVELNPRMQFGVPVVKGTRVPVSTVVANLEVGSPREVASWYGLTVEQVNGARAYLNSVN